MQLEAGEAYSDGKKEKEFKIITGFLSKSSIRIIKLRAFKNFSEI
jgi:hypothetical protein